MLKKKIIILIGLEDDNGVGGPPGRKLKGFITKEDELETICGSIRVSKFVSFIIFFYVRKKVYWFSYCIDEILSPATLSATLSPALLFNTFYSCLLYS